MHIWHSCQNISFGWQANVLHGGSPGSVRPGVIFIFGALILLLICLRLAPLPSGSKCCPAPWGLASPWLSSPSSSLSITTSSWPIVFTISSTPWGKHHVWLNWQLTGAWITCVQVWTSLEQMLFNMGRWLTVLWACIQFLSRAGVCPNLRNCYVLNLIIFTPQNQEIRPNHVSTPWNDNDSLCLRLMGSV